MFLIGLLAVACKSEVACRSATIDVGTVKEAVGVAYAGITRFENGVAKVLVATPNVEAVRQKLDGVLECKARVVGVKYSYSDLDSFANRAVNLLDERPDLAFHGVGIDEASNRIVVSSEADPFPARERRVVLGQVPEDAVRFVGGEARQTTGPR